MSLFIPPGVLRNQSGHAILDGLVSWWSLNETSGVRVDLHSGYDVSPVDTVSFGVGKKGNAVSLVRTGHLSRSHVAALDFAGDFTACTWAKQIGGIVGEGIVSQWTSVGSPGGWMLFHSASSASFYVSATASVVIGGMTTNAWVMLLGWYDSAAGTASISINNGTPVTAAKTRVRDSAAPFNIGSHEDASAKRFNGLIDESCAWNRLLTAGEKAALYNSGAGMSYPG